MPYLEDLTVNEMQTLRMSDDNDNCMLVLAVLLFVIVLLGVWVYLKLVI